MHMDKLKVKIILGSTRQNRFSDKPGAWIAGIAKQRPDMDVEILDLRDYPMPFFDEPVSSSSKKEPFKNEAVVKWTAKIAEADAYVIVAPEYNHSMPAVLKNALDYVYQEWNNKPVGFVSYGSVMGARSVEQLRLVAVELQLAPIRNTVHVPVDVLVKAAGWAGPADPSVLSSLDDKAKGLLDQLLWWGSALKVARAKA